MIANRKEAREAIYGLIFDQLPSAQAVFDHQPVSFAAGSPIAYLSSAGSARPPLTGQGARHQFFISAHIVVLFSDPNSSPVYTNDQAEDSLDLIESELYAAIRGNRRKENFWQDLRYMERTLAEDVIVVGGATYFHEIIPLIMEVY